MYRVCKSCLTHVERAEERCPFCEAPLEETSNQRHLKSVARVSGRSSMLAAALGVTLSLNIACNKLAPEPQPALYGGPPIEEVPVAEEPAMTDMGSDAADAGAPSEKDMAGEQGAAKPNNRKINVDTPPASIYGGPPVDIYGAPPIDEDELKRPEPDSVKEEDE